MSTEYNIAPERELAIVRMATALRGTNKEFEEAEQEFGLYPMTEAEKEYLEEHIVQCYECGRWFRPTDLIEGLCDDCYEEELEAAAREEEGEEDE